ncbi:hypothetical protein Y032_0021g450 [Ancylostoma ceylanicum]|uniref:Peptidase metallopeptidase domain-containing protein n=2 Tax=Ancylostoma ceylanicum TaxID=53326 RepID=A0A016V0P4_9BILA|nr:hypothetical protein Y032_0021g450 [Ancylostoma ceylanicum]
MSRSCFSWTSVPGKAGAKLQARPGSGTAGSLEMATALLSSVFLLLTGLCWALDEVKYLRQFGYLPSGGAESQLTNDAVARALRRFQRMFGLPQTGKLDAATTKLMSKPRCGVKDIQQPSRLKRSLPHPRWKSNKFTFLVTAWSRRLDPGNVDATITRALAEWQKHANLEFRRAQDPILNMKFGVGYHQCEYPFTSSVLAHAFRPRTTSFEPKDDPSNLIGDIHFNDDVPWSSPLLLATAIHEIGHSLGLPHVLNDVNSIMYPILVEGQQFTPHDIKTIQEMYGPPVGRGSKPSNPTQSTNRESNERRSRESEETREEEEKPDEAPRPCSSGADAITTYRGEFIVFKNKWLWRVVKDGHLLYGPNLISDIFPGIPEKIDAAVEIHGQIWIFAGNQYWIFSERRLLHGPRPLSHLGIPENVPRIRLAYRWHYFDPPATYLWAEDEYWKLDVRTRKVEDSYARRISLNWKHVPAGATAAFSRDKELYFIRGDLVYRMNTTDYRLPVSEGYPVSISKFWPFCEDENQSVRYASPQTSFTKALPYPLITTVIFITVFLSSL